MTDAATKTSFGNLPRLAGYRVGEIFTKKELDGQELQLDVRGSHGSCSCPSVSAAVPKPTFCRDRGGLELAAKPNDRRVHHPLCTNERAKWAAGGGQLSGKPKTTEHAGLVLLAGNLT